MNWETVSLGDVATIERKTIQPAQLPPNSTYLGLEHIAPGGDIVGATTVAEARVASAKYAFDSDHVLYGKLRPNLGKICRPDFDGVCSTDIFPIRAGSSLDRDYLAYFLSQPSTVALASLRASGANLPRLSLKQLEAFQLPVPPMEEQTRIASILDQADEICTRRRAQLEYLDELPQALFHEMFGHLPADTQVSDIAAPQKGSIRTGPFGSQLLHSEFVDSGIAVLGLDNVVSNTFRWAKRRFITPVKYEELKRYTVHEGDVLISIMGTVGRCVVVPNDIPIAINTKHICAITLDQSKALPAYVRGAFLGHPTSRRYLSHETKGAIMAGLNMRIIKAMPLPAPSIAAQQEFAEKVEAIQEEQDRVAQALEVDEELFAALRYRAFRGEL